MNGPHKETKLNLDKVLRRHNVPPADSLESAAERVLQRLRVQSESDPAFATRVAENTPPVSGRRQVRWVPAFGAATALVALVLISALVLLGPIGGWDASATVSEVGGSLERTSETSGQPIRSGDRIQPGEILRSGGGRSSMLALADGSQIEMRSRSQLTLSPADDGVRIRLAEGSVIVNAAEQRTGHLYVQTPDLDVSVVGTVFLVKASKEGSQVSVIQGEVRVQHGDNMRGLLPGEQMETAQRRTLRSVAEEISWSRNAREHFALLRQAAAIAPVQGRPSPWAVVAGSVRSSNRDNIAGKRVVLQLNLGAEAQTPFVIETTTRLDGSYRLEQIPAGRYLISLPETETEPRPLEILPGSHNEAIDFRLP